MRLPALLPLPLLLAALAACADRPAAVTGRADFQTFCVSCHGATGRGDGPLAAQVRPHPADLGRIAMRNGGVFPMTAVMSTIDGYSRGQHGTGGPMPEFGAVLEGPTVLYDDGSGDNPVPVPLRLLQLAEYVRSLQQPG